MPKVRMKFVSKTFGAGNLPGQIRPHAEGWIESVLKKVKKGHEKYVESWETSLSTPDFYIGFDYEGAHTLIGYVAMEAEKAEDATLSVWQLLDRGTDIRYMILERGWKSKTWPVGSFPSNEGFGFAIRLGDPRRGIDERNIAELVAEEVMPDPDIEGAYESAMRHAFGAHDA